MYQALYRKWRPKIFDDVLGQQHITDTLKNQIASGKLSHAYLFSGSRGTGKTSTAKILARAVNCLNPIGSNPCNECAACRSSLDSSAVDIIEMDAASNNKVEDARAITDEVIYTPAELKKKVYIIDEAHMLTSNAFNALLKTLEEPPEHVLFIFATTEPHKFPPTILSRCQRFDFKRITPFDIEKRLKFIAKAENYLVSEDALGLISQVADGAMRDALGILDQCFSNEKDSININDVINVTGVSDPNFIYDFVKLLIAGDLSSCFMRINDAYDEGRDMQKLPDELVGAFRNILVAKTIFDKEDLEKVLCVGSHTASIYSDIANSLSIEKILRYIDIVSKASYFQRYVNNPRLSLEIAVTGIARHPDSVSVDGLTERIAELENKVRMLEKYMVSGNMNLKSAINMSTVEPIDTKEEKKVVLSEKLSEKKEDNLSEVSDHATENDSDFSHDEASLDASVSEEPDFPIEAEEFTTDNQAVSYEKGELERMWNDAFQIAKENSIMGFENFIGKARRVFLDDEIDFYFSEKIYYDMSKVNKFDESIKAAYKKLLKKSIPVRFMLGSTASVQKNKNDNFDELLSKLGNND